MNECSMGAECSHQNGSENGHKKTAFDVKAVQFGRRKT